jgi:phage baseplate assembly protein W
MANNTVVIPRWGLHSQAQLYSSQSGPFRIIPNETTLTVQSASETVSLDLETGSRVETDIIVREFNTASESIVAENVNGHIVLTETASMGVTSWIEVGGSVLPSLGFDLQTRSKGKEVYPAWELAPRPDTVLTNRFPRFLYPVRQNPVFKVTYRVPVRRCLRCGGSGVENDYRFDGQGLALEVENENLLQQAALKILLTTKGSNPFHKWYGSTLKSRVGTKAVGLIAAIIDEDVRRALENLQRLQVEQARYQAVSYKERLATIKSVRTFPLKEDPTSFYVETFVTNASREPVNVSTFFTVPDVISLNGDGFGQGV